MDIVVGNEHDDLSSNPERDCFSNSTNILWYESNYSPSSYE